jgi:hypothetical protein
LSEDEVRILLLKTQGHNPGSAGNRARIGGNS